MTTEPFDAIDVIRAPGTPQAETQSNGARSLSTLTAKPCIVTWRETWIPIEAIFASPAQTPVSLSGTRAAIPSSASAAISAASRSST